DRGINRQQLRAGHRGGQAAKRDLTELAPRTIPSVHRNLLSFESFGSFETFGSFGTFESFGSFESFVVVRVVRSRSGRFSFEYSERSLERSERFGTIRRFRTGRTNRTTKVQGCITDRLSQTMLSQLKTRSVPSNSFA